MVLGLFLFILAFIGLLFTGFMFWLMIKVAKGLLGGIISFIICITGFILLCIAIYFSFRDSITSDYRSCDVIATYNIFDMTSIDEDTTLINYVDDNNELKHIKSDKVKIFYDLNDDKEPYLRKVEYWRWFIYWTEVEVHIRE